MANDAREIYEAVLGEVRKELSKEFEEIKHHAEQIADTYDRRINELENKVHVLEKRLNKAEQKLNQKDLAEIRDDQKVESKISSATKPKKKIDMSRYDISVQGYKFNGWIYYANQEMGEFLYKVRVDGSDNQQLTDYSVDPYFSVKDGKLFFEDKDLNEHCIPIS